AHSYHGQGVRGESNPPLRGSRPRVQHRYTTDTIGPPGLCPGLLYHAPSGLLGQPRRGVIQKPRPTAWGRAEGAGVEPARPCEGSTAFRAVPVAIRVALPYFSRPGWTRTTGLPHVEGLSWPLNDGPNQHPDQEVNPERLVRGETGGPVHPPGA